MTARVITGLLILVFCFSILACGGPKDGSEAAAKKNVDDVAAKVFEPGKEVEEGIFKEAEAKEPVPEPEEPSEPPSEEKEDTAMDEGDYTKPDVTSGNFEPAAKDPLTGSAWEDLIAVIETNKGTIKIKFYHDAAPRHVENFVWLCRDGFYDGLKFHRYVPGFVIQGGDPEGTGQGGPGYQVPAEFSDKKHVKSAVASARKGDQVNPQKKSSGSQYYICLEDTPHLDGGYTVWGKVIEGMDVVLDLREGDVMAKITIREKK
jgi:cyclophilin family peptidyl-prolyl cis-trans isomerase